MKEWEYTFDPVSRQDWIKQIETDLRQKPFSSLEGEWWPGEPLIPLVHPEDQPVEPVRLPDHLFRQPPLITEWIHTPGKSAVEVNEKIHDALQHGAQSIILRTDFQEGIDFSQWLKEVIQDIVSIAVQPDDVARKDFPLLSKISQHRLLLRVKRDEQSMPLDHLLPELLSSGMQPDQLRFVYAFPSQGNWISQTAQSLNILLKDFHQWTSIGLDPDLFFNQYILSVTADPFYFKHLIQSRVIHVLWKNISVQLKVNIKSDTENYFECHIEQHEGEHPDQFLVRASESALAASLSGTHSLCIHHSDLPDLKPFYRRINRNIHHLLHLESGMYKGTDPLSGAYALDFHIRSWSPRIWDLLSF